MPSAEQDIAAIDRITAVPTILQVVCETTGLGFSVIARVTPDAWTACAVRDSIAFGLAPGDELDVATTLCSEVRDARQAIVIDHASADDRYCAHPTPKLYGFESYIAVPIFRRNGEYFGTLCALDPRPAKLRESKSLAMMTLFADLLSLQLQAEEQHAESQAALAEARSAAELREQFIAVLGHDLRGPLSSITMGAGLLLRKAVPDGARTTLERIQRSARRIELLVEDVLDLARGRLGGGVPLAPADLPDLETPLRHVVDEAASSHAGRSIRFLAQSTGPVRCDRQRIEQVLSNLLANALEHGDPNEPVEVSLWSADDQVHLSVVNRGEPIPADVLPRLFQPFSRGAAGPRRSGLGLGLYIVAEVARAHGGSVGVTSSPEQGTCFTVSFPRRAAERG